MEIPDKINDSIASVRNFQENMKTAVANLQNSTENKDASEDPLYKMMDNITEDIIEVLQSETVINALNSIAQDTSDETAKSLVELFTTAMAFSAFNAVSEYERYLGPILNDITRNISDRFRRNEADIHAMSSAIQVLKDRIDKLNSE